jgi:hypothetical protein
VTFSIEICHERSCHIHAPPCPHRQRRQPDPIQDHDQEGISQAVIERQDDWPKAIVLRLHLKGLESFRVANGKVRLDAAVSIQEGKPKVRLWKDGKEDAPLDDKSPFWTDIRIVGGDGKPAKALPLKDGFFEGTLPRALFEGDPKTITVAWIDFYRN